MKPCRDLAAPDVVSASATRLEALTGHMMTLNIVTTRLKIYADDHIDDVPNFFHYILVKRTLTVVNIC